MTINIGKTLVGGIQQQVVFVGLILKSGTSAGNTDITTCRIYDPSRDCE